MKKVVKWYSARVVEWQSGTAGRVGLRSGFAGSPSIFYVSLYHFTTVSLLLISL